MRIAWAVREAFDNGHAIYVAPEAVHELAARIPGGGLLEVMDRLLLDVASLTQSADKAVKVQIREFPRYHAMSLGELNFAIRELTREGLVRKGPPAKSRF